MYRVVSRSGQVVIDLAVLSLALWLAYLIRFDWVLSHGLFKRLVFTWPYVVGFEFLLLALYGVPRFAWRYVGLREVGRVAAATTTATLIFLAFRFGSGAVIKDWVYATYTLIPIGVIALNAMLGFLGICGVRVLRRILGERTESLRRRRGLKGPRAAAVPTLLIGAGQAGLLVARELIARPDLGMLPVAFLDDDARKHGTTVHGVRVVGGTDQLVALARKHRATGVLITIANAPGPEIRRIKDLCDAAGLPAKIIPGLYEIVGGQVNLSRIRDVSIEDLLGREPVALETDSILASMRGKVVLVTGAGGSIGSELCRQVCRFEPKLLVLVEQAENSLFHVHRELIAAHPELAGRILPRIADVTDARRVEAIFTTTRPDVVFHAAAHKHVPMMEWNPGEAVKNNVWGTRVLADLSHLHGVSRFVMISTDKAVNPTSVMGASKRTAEIYVQALAQKSKTRFVTVRFGNVLGSAGSVIPLFQEQIARGGPVLVTHPEMKRYFMTIPESCQLVLQAGTMGQGGEIFILDMGEPVKIVDLARDLIRLSGLRPGEDIEIQFSGTRPGEKLFEELSVAAELAVKTRHPKIFIGRIRPYSLEEITRQIEELRLVVDGSKPGDVLAKLRQIVPEYSPDFGSAAIVALPAGAGPSAPTSRTEAPADQPRTPLAAGVR